MNTFVRYIAFFIKISCSILLILLFSYTLVFTQSTDTLIARQYVQEAILLSDSSHYDSALIMNQQAIFIFEQQDSQDILSLSDLYNQAGDCYQEKGDYQTALAHFNKSQKCLKNASNRHETGISFFKNNLTPSRINSRIAKTYNHFGVLHMTLGDFETAFKYHEQSLNLRLTLWDEQHPKVADSYNNIGNCLISVGDYEQALMAHKLALDIRRQVLGQQHLDVATSYHNLGGCWLGKGEAKRALSFYKKALNIRQEQLGQQHAKVASSLKNIGNALKAIGDIETAIDFYKKALDIEQNLYGEQAIQIAGTFNNIGNNFSKKGDDQQALIFYQKALDIQLASYDQQHPDVADSYGNMGNAYLNKGDYKLAEHFFRQAMNIRQNIFGEEHQKVALSFDNLGLCYRYMGDLPKAAKHHQMALIIQKKILGDEHFYVGVANANLATCFLKNEVYPEALAYYQKAQDIFKNKLGNQHPYLVSNYGNLGICYLEVQQYEQALVELHKALNILEKTPGDHQQAQAKYYKTIGVVYQKQGNFQKALDFYQKGLHSLHFQQTNIAPSLELLDLLSGQASTRFRLYQQNTSSESLSTIASDYEQILQLMDTLRQTFQEQESKQILARNNYQIFEAAMSVYLEQWKQSQNLVFLEKAFALSEKSKSIILLEALQKSNVDSFKGIPDSLLAKEYDLRVNLSYLEKKRDTKAQNSSNTYMDTLENKIFDIRRDYQALIQNFKQDYPDYFQLKYDRRTTSIQEVQTQLLAPDQAMLHYFIGDSSIFLFLISPEITDAFELKKDFPLGQLVKQLREGLFGYPFAGKSTAPTLNEDYLSSAEQLYQKIILPVLDRHDLPERLLIVPDDALGFLPFDALLKKCPTKTTRFKNHAYLLDDFAVSYSFSATLLARMLHRKTLPTKQKVLAFAPTFENNSLGLSNLSFNLQEAEQILSLFDGDLVDGKKATLKAFQEKASDYYILHLGTHGKTNLEASEYSYLAFTEIQDSLNNELLYIKDLYNMKLKAAMVVLSACETGIGQYKRGEGIVSLARGFSYAGARSIITTLWSINDQKTAQLMALFYKKLQTGLPKDVALQQAKKEFMAVQVGHEEAHPYFWSGYIAIGEMKPLDWPWTWWQWTLLSLSAVVFFYLMLSIRSRIWSNAA